MKFPKPLRVALCFVVFLVGCATPIAPTFTIGSPSDYGAFPTNCQGLVKAYIQTSFKDPGSVRQLDIDPPRTFCLQYHTIYASTWLMAHHYPENTVVYGYIVYFFTNEKQTLGDPTGRQICKLFIRDGQVIDDLTTLGK